MNTNRLLRVETEKGGGGFKSHTAIDEHWACPGTRLIFELLELLQHVKGRCSGGVLHSSCRSGEHRNSLWTSETDGVLMPGQSDVYGKRARCLFACKHARKTGVYNIRC